MDANERDAIIERQREHLHDLDLWAKRLKGPCLACRWREGGYERCTNPAVMKGQPNPVSGEVEWKGPLCRWERMPEYPERNDWGNWTDERWRGPTLCGPEGLLFEPRSFNQFFVRWALNGLWFVPLVVVAIVAAHG